MSYPINKTNGDVYTTLLDGTTNTDSGLTLIGRNYPNYGEVQNENFIHLLENFASTLPPGQSIGFAPLAGQLWWDTGTQRLKVYTGGEFAPVSEQTVSSTAPTVKKTGDQWWNTSTSQLSIWTGTGWQLIGPVYTNAQGVSGEVVSTITDTNSNTHVIVTGYAGGNVVSITSTGNVFTPGSAIAGFGNIHPGINLEANAVINGTANNSVRVGGLFANVLARVDVNSAFTRDISVGGKIVLTDANVYFTNKNLVVQNTNLGGNIELYTNSNSSGNIKSLSVNGATGLVSVSAVPTTSLGVATKGYVDGVNSGLTDYINAQVLQINGNTNQLRADYLANISVVIQTTNANLLAYSTYANAEIQTTNANLGAYQIWSNANASVQSTAIATINSTLLTLAPNNNPNLTGTVTAPNVALGSNSNVVATTYYVDASDVILRTDYISRDATLAAAADANLANGLALKANIAGTTFTGNVYAPTPAAGDNSTKIATTAFVTTAITAQKFNYTIANSAPGVTAGVISSTNGAAGNNGDFWFQVG
jgi:hypothetical protein